MYQRAIGIIGGMGPFSGSALFEEVLRQAVARGARANHEFPRVVVTSAPVHDLVTDEREVEATVRVVRQELERQSAAGAGVVAIACITMHAYFAELFAELPIEPVSLVSVAVEAARAEGARRPLLLCSATSSRLRVLAAPLEAAGATPVHPSAEDEARLGETIRRLVAGAAPATARALVMEIVARGLEAGADAVILGCTELSPFADLKVPVPIVDPMVQAAARLCDLAARQAR